MMAINIVFVQVSNERSLSNPTAKDYGTKSTVYLDDNGGIISFVNIA